MNYPEWAPKTLVEQHKRRTVGNQAGTKYKTIDPDTIAATITRKFGHIQTGLNAEDVSRNYYRKWMRRRLPDQQRTELLEKLITDLTMKRVWTAIAKRSTDESDPWQFFIACERGIGGWRGDQKQTKKKRNAFHQKIHDTARELETLMAKASEFDSYSLAELVNGATADALIKALGSQFSGRVPAGQETDHARYWLASVLPSADDVLADIAEKAKRYRDQPLIVKQPNSRDAKIHYFVRQLSKYCKRTYAQPLHDVVALTTSVIFDLQDFDSDHVKKTVNR